MPLDYRTESAIAHFLQSLEGVTEFTFDQKAMDSAAEGVTRLYDNGEPVASGEAWERAGGVRWRMPPAPAPVTKSTSSVRARVCAHLPRAMRGGD